MLIRRAVLDRVVAGEIDLVFRRWRRPTVVAGGTPRTSVGMLEIVTVDRVARRRITAAEAARAGFDSRAALLRVPNRREVGDLDRIQVRAGGTDPRIALLERSEPTPPSCHPGGGGCEPT